MPIWYLFLELEVLDGTLYDFLNPDIIELFWSLKNVKLHFLKQKKVNKNFLQTKLILSCNVSIIDIPLAIFIYIAILSSWMFHPKSRLRDNLIIFTVCDAVFLSQHVKILQKMQLGKIWLANFYRNFDKNNHSRQYVA